MSPSPAFGLQRPGASPVLPIPLQFEYQSYFDSTLLQRALLTQNPGEDIVRSTLTQSQVKGYGVGLHALSECPVAVKFTGGLGVGSSNTFILRPGESIWPGTREVVFAGLDYGLPFGWLGGGVANLFVAQTPDSEFNLGGGAAEVIFHRARYAIKQPADLTAGGSFNNAPKNWPNRFPWINAVRGSSSLQQQGPPQITVSPTRTLFVLRGIDDTTIMTSCRVRAIFQATNDVGIDSAGDPILTNPFMQFLSFDLAASVGTSGNLATQNMATMMVNGIFDRIGADEGGIVFVDASDPAASLEGSFIDVVRYGRI